MYVVLHYSLGTRYVRSNMAAKFQYGYHWHVQTAYSFINILKTKSDKKLGWKVND